MLSFFILWSLIQPITSTSLEAVQSLVENVEIDLDAPLSDEDE